MTAREVAFGEVLATRHTEDVDKKIKAILEEGKVVKFTNIFTGKSKYVKEWNQDDMGDLEAFYYPGCMNQYICPYAIEYQITGVDMDQIETTGEPEEVPE